MPPSGVKAGAGISKDKVNYRHHEQCSTCMYFYPLNSCKIVEGNISPEMVCDKWAMAEAKAKYKDKNFFTTEYEKSQGGT